MADTIIGRVVATEKNPTTIDNFTFWTDPELILNPFDIVKVQHVNNSFSYGVIEDIAHITDAASFLTNFISSDFGDVNAEENTLRVGMNYVSAKVVCNTDNIYIPLQSNAKVMLATAKEINYALGLNDIRNPLVCGYLEMYDGTKGCEKVTLPVNLNSKFIIGPEGAHLNISGISGLASKTSYAMFLLKAIQDSYMKKNPQNDDNEDSVAFVLFNVKGKDLLAIDQLNDFSDERNPEQARNETLATYEKLGLSAEPFKNVHYYYPYSIPKTRHWNTYMTPEEVADNIKKKKGKKYKYIYKYDKDNLDLMFANIDDSTQTMESIISYIMSGQGKFNQVGDWQEFLEAVKEKCSAETSGKDKEIPVASWRKFYRVINKSITDNKIFARDIREDDGETRIGDALKYIKKNEVHVIDIAKLSEDKQAYVFGDAIRTIYDLQLGQYAGEEGVNPPSRVVIFIDELNKYASKDTGVRAADFIEDVGDIANSNKEIGKNKGFRGIGRLCGLAYCKTLKFTTSYLGECIKSIMTCNAEKMRAMLVENKKYTLDEIWDAIVTYSTESEEKNEHYFEVEMFGINKENTDLLNDKKVRDYLSFVVPVPYKNTFVLRNQVYSYAKSIDYSIDEYCVRVNGSQIFKEYTTKLKEQSGASLKNYDEISRLEFKDFRDTSGKLVAWMWIGLSRFEKQIPSVNRMRGLRLRSSNIQLGNDDTLQFLFKEKRGNYYFVGEVFSVSRELIPNSQRDYFNENETRVLFEDLLRTYFYDVLHKLYYEANRVKNDYKRQEEYLSKISEYHKKENGQGFVDEEERQKLQYDIDRAKKSAEDARKRLDKLDTTDPSSPLSEIRKSIGQKYEAEKLKRKAETATITTEDDKKKPFITSGMSKLSRSERKLVSKILSIITDIAPKDIAEQIIEKIKEEMR